MYRVVESRIADHGFLTRNKVLELEKMGKVSEF